MRRIRFVEALREGMRQEMENDRRVAEAEAFALKSPFPAPEDALILSGDHME